MNLGIKIIEIPKIDVFYSFFVHFCQHLSNRFCCTFFVRSMRQFRYNNNWIQWTGIFFLSCFDMIWFETNNLKSIIIICEFLFRWVLISPSLSRSLYFSLFRPYSTLTFSSSLGLPIKIPRVTKCKKSLFNWLEIGWCAWWIEWPSIWFTPLFHTGTS